MRVPFNVVISNGGAFDSETGELATLANGDAPPPPPQAPPCRTGGRPGLATGSVRHAIGTAGFRPKRRRKRP